MSETADRVDFHLPDIGEGLAEAEIVRWLVEPGETITEDQPIVEVETDKAVVEITAPFDGTLVEHGGGSGDVLKIGAVLAVLAPGHGAASEIGGAGGNGGAAGNGAAATEPAATTRTTPATPTTATRTAAASRGQDVPAQRVLATPATRGLARELGVDLREVNGSGPGGRIVDADVRTVADGTTPIGAPRGEPSISPAATSSSAIPTAASDQPAGPVRTEPPPAPGARAPAEGPQPGTTVPMRGLRRRTAQRMTAAWREVPHVNSVHEVDLHELLDLRTHLAAAGHRVPLTAFLVKATATALVRWPSLNATVDEEAEEIAYHEQVDLAVAADTDDGLLVPVLRGVDQASLARVGRELTEAMTRARERRLAPEELRGATFTVNNYGPLGGWFGTSLVSPGQVAILSMGPARDRVVPVDGEIVIRPIAVLALAADHRVADGRELIGFCLTVRELLENPLSLLMED